jgi:cell division protein ZapA (FtsZ GTPase activity inhibitor)
LGSVKSSFRIDILGTSLSLAADEEPAYLEGLLTRFRNAVENTRKMTGLEEPLSLAVLTGFLLCDEIQKLQNRSNLSGTLFSEDEVRQNDEAEKITLSLIDKVEKINEILQTR